MKKTVIIILILCFEAQSQNFPNATILGKYSFEKSLNDSSIFGRHLQLTKQNLVDSLFVLNRYSKNFCLDISKINSSISGIIVPGDSIKDGYSFGFWIYSKDVQKYGGIQAELNLFNLPIAVLPSLTFGFGYDKNEYITFGDKNVWQFFFFNINIKDSVVEAFTNNGKTKAEYNFINDRDIFSFKKDTLKVIFYSQKSPVKPRILIDDIVLYNRLLTDNEVLNLAKFPGDICSYANLTVSPSLNFDENSIYNPSNSNNTVITFSGSFQNDLDENDFKYWWTYTNSQYIARYNSNQGSFLDSYYQSQRSFQVFNSGISNDSITLYVSYPTCNLTLTSSIRMKSKPASISNIIYENSEIICFPNPTNGVLNFENVRTSTSYQIFNTLGVQLLSGELEIINPAIDINNLKPGIYYLSLKTKVNKIKLVKN